MTATAQARYGRQARIIKALAHPSRLAIAEALEAGERCVCDLTDLIGADMSTVSKHLTVMRDAGLLDAEKRGLKVFYRLRCACLMSFLDCVDDLVPEKKNAAGRK